MKKEETVTRRWGDSSSAWKGSPFGLPSRKLPPGTAIIRKDTAVPGMVSS
jgi:hypothetical protein